ncbi:MAG: bacillithiol biosynthesis deacetylase BshB1 [Bacteroidetes bacterium]|nr:bacillithiol biosynthesis deacetylase BshB1 [Bacteroidota bacterium]
MKIDVLAFGVHPDDVELSCSGVLMVEKSNGKTTGIIDLTEGELGTRGTIDTRKQEAADAAEILGVDIRENVQLADGFFENNKASQIKIIEKIRKYQPEIILCNAVEDRHPDHGRSAQLVADAAFLSGLRKIETTTAGVLQEAWRPKYVLHYIQDRYLNPDFVVDISNVFERKLDAIRAYKTQFHQPGMEGPQTYISTPDFLDSVIYRSKMMGKMIGVKYAEGFITKKKIGISNFDALIKHNT